MPRDVNGVYVLPAGNPVVSTTTISSTWANSTLADIATALTNSLSIDGSVTNAKLATDSVSTIKIQNGAVTTGKLADGAVTDAKTAVEIYKRSNILGTVSESGGIPTGAIMETGTNANGRYIKYADGTLITTAYFAQGGTVITTANGSLFIGTASARTWPATFVADPVYSVTAYSGGSASVIGAPRPAALSTTSITLQPISSASQASITVDYRVIAIGRWF